MARPLMLKRYVEAVTCLGRPLRDPDRHGPWSASLHFNRRVKSRIAAGKCSVSLFEAVKDLLYFLSDSRAEYTILLAHRAIAFKTKHGRRPLQYNIGEARDLTDLRVLHRVHRAGRLPESIVSLLSQHDLLPTYSRRTWFEAFEALHTFVEEQERMPSDRSSDPEERRLSSAVKYIRRQDKNGLLSPDQRRAVSSIPRILVGPGRGHPIARGPK
jgi:hypothetical protein